MERIMMNNEEVKASPESGPIDPWAAAFEKIREENSQPVNPISNAQNPEGTNGDPTSNDGQSGSAVVPGADGGSNTDPNVSAGEGELSEADLESYVSNIEERARKQAIEEINAQMIKEGVRNSDGVAQASIFDEDIYSKGEDGIPVFRNPDTQRPFEGANPRQQAQDWVDGYNQRLEAAFNDAAGARMKSLMKEQQPLIDLAKFAPVYESLGTQHQALFDQAVEEYEILDKENNIIGYSCDLNKVLAKVNRQMETLAGINGGQIDQPAMPAMDMKASGSESVVSPSEIKSLEDAMRYVQNKEKKKGKK